jgi:hypothetical protein
MLKDKTEGNLHPQEARLLEGLLGDLRIQYVQLVRATEEKLKAQAAQKFSGATFSAKNRSQGRGHRGRRVKEMISFSACFEFLR